MGRRLRYQSFDVAQLVVETTAKLASDADSATASLATAAAPRQLPLEDEDRLEHIQFTETEHNAALDAERLEPLDQCMLLAWTYETAHLLSASHECTRNDGTILSTGHARGGRCSFHVLENAARDEQAIEQAEALVRVCRASVGQSTLVGAVH